MGNNQLPFRIKEGSFKRDDFVSFLGNELKNFVEQYKANHLPDSLKDKELYFVMDNASIHKNGDVERTLRSIGLTPVYLPPYGPIFNPCELVFGQIKKRMRSDHKSIETSQELMQRVQHCFQSIKTETIHRYYNHCGYRA